MSEYIEVEQPFLAQLAAKDWTVIDQCTHLLQHAVPSWRGSFRSWWLPGVSREAVAVVSTLAVGVALVIGGDQARRGLVAEIAQRDQPHMAIEQQVLAGRGVHLCNAIGGDGAESVGAGRQRWRWL